MKKNLSFIPLGIGISAAIIYLFNVFRFRIISNSATLLQILSSLKIYLYISIGGFVFYFLIKIIFILNNKDNNIEDEVYNNTYKSLSSSKLYKSVESNNYPTYNLYEPNYDYVPLYNENKYDKKQTINEEFEKENNNIIYCNNCGENVSDSDVYCKRCGRLLKSNRNSLFKKIINLLEIIILILIIYFLLNMLFDYKEKQDPNFKSPFNVAITK